MKYIGIHSTYNICIALPTISVHSKIDAYQVENATSLINTNAH